MINYIIFLIVISQRQNCVVTAQCIKCRPNPKSKSFKLEQELWIIFTSNIRIKKNCNLSNFGYDSLVDKSDRSRARSSWQVQAAIKAKVTQITTLLLYGDEKRSQPAQNIKHWSSYNISRLYSSFSPRTGRWGCHGHTHSQSWQLIIKKHFFFSFPKCILHVFNLYLQDFINCATAILENCINKEVFLLKWSEQ